MGRENVGISAKWNSFNICCKIGERALLGMTSGVAESRESGFWSNCAVRMNPLLSYSLLLGL